MSEPVRVGILTISDGVSAGWRGDESGDRIRRWSDESGFDVAARAVVPDESEAIADTLREWADGGMVDLVLTTGGTGFTERDVTPEATQRVIERGAPGISEWIRAVGVKKTPYAALSRGLAGIRGQVLIVNLPGSPSGVTDGLAVLSGLVVHAIELLRGQPCHGPDGPES